MKKKEEKEISQQENGVWIRVLPYWCLHLSWVLCVDTLLNYILFAILWNSWWLSVDCRWEWGLRLCQANLAVLLQLKQGVTEPTGLYWTSNYTLKKVLFLISELWHNNWFILIFPPLVTPSLVEVVFINAAMLLNSRTMTWILRFCWLLVSWLDWQKMFFF